MSAIPTDQPRPRTPKPAKFRHTEFYEALVAHAVPIDLRALKALKGSPLALDIYAWLTYRMSYLRRPCLIPWEALHTRDFKSSFLDHLADVLHVYPAARLSAGDRGLLMSPRELTSPKESDCLASRTARCSALRLR